MGCLRTRRWYNVVNFRPPVNVSGPPVKPIRYANLAIMNWAPSLLERIGATAEPEIFAPVEIVPEEDSFRFNLPLLRCLVLFLLLCLLKLGQSWYFY